MAEGKEPKVDLPVGGDDDSVGSVESSRGDLDGDSNIYPREAQYASPQTGNPRDGNQVGGDPSSSRSLNRNNNNTVIGSGVVVNAGGDLDLDMSQFPVKLGQEDPAVNIAFNAFNQNKFDFGAIGDYKAGGAAFGTGVYNVSKNDETFVKSVSSIKYSLNDNFESFVSSLTSNAIAYNCSTRTFKTIAFCAIKGSAGDLVNDMLPMSGHYLSMDAPTYLAALRTRLAPHTEGKLLWRVFKARVQNRNESPKFYAIDKLNMYKRVVPLEQRSLTKFFEYTIRGFSNPHLKKYMLDHLSECGDEVRFQRILQEASVHVLRCIESGILRKTDKEGLDNKLIKSSYLGVKDNNTETGTGKVNVVEKVEGSTSPVFDSSEEEMGTVNIVVKQEMGQTSNMGAKPKMKGKMDQTNSACYYCGKNGHFRKECFKRLRDLNLNSLEELAQFSDSETEEIEQLMKINAITKKTGRKAINAITRASQKKKPSAGVNKPGVNSVKTGKEPVMSGDAEGRLARLEVKVNSLIDLVTDRSLGTGNSTGTFLGVDQNQMTTK